MIPGQIIHLNGTSSAGKSTIAAALQRLLHDPHHLTGIDHFLRSLPADVVVASEEDDPPPAVTWQAVFRKDRMIRVEIGPKGLHLLEAMYCSIAAISASGIGVIVDDVIYDPRVFEIALHTLPARQVLFVGIRCPIEIAEERERARGDRAAGGARFFGERVHEGRGYDLEVDSAELSPEECAVQIKRAIQDPPSPTAYERQAMGLVTG